MKETFEEFKEKYQKISYENMMHQFYFEHNDLLEMNQANEKLFNRNQILKNKIQKAIEYIENYNYEIEEYKGYVIATIGTEELLNILKGNEENE